MNYECLTKDQSEYQELSLALPAIETDNKRFLIAGVSGVLRWAIKSHIEKFSNHFSKSLLGFRGGCLAACAEGSVWTNFCEVQLPSSVCEMKFTMNDEEESVVIPPSLVLLEAHLKRPVRTHNILKRKLDIAKKAKQVRSKESQTNTSINAPVTNIEFTVYDNNLDPIKSDDISKTLENLIITEKSEEFSLHHNYLEGIDLTLADMIAFPCVYYLLKNLPSEVLTHLEDVKKWFERMFSNLFVKKAATKCGFLLNTFFPIKEDMTKKIIVPVVDKDSLYKRDPTHTKMRCKHKNPIEILTLLQFLEWEKLPPDLHPATGDLPQERIERKCQQIESMVTAVLKVAIDGQIIVEFCAGGGHVGLLLAYFLPSCKVILIENKESSILRAKKRVESLNLKNVFFYQCNLDYFKGSFDLGVSLHACGVATDLVIQQCIKQRASFVCCPCCYGGVQNTHLLSYPLSKRFCSTSISYEKYLFLAHCADRTEVNTPTAEQGELCMGLIDSDRAFFAQEYNYKVLLTTLQPKSCSPKHNLLIGKSPKLQEIVTV
ncbi:glutathione S-transferase C-terminal domain-containing protein [Caerostris darwini]|uniref:Glutathione S-transferase C-terminal domain-containing protein n=1 Tax=Caerostris darwini TaxID=1538125 RepID=A0AAV4R9N1_9ARAC|nr:glutathione S-transferase C-terminal domain-containing protein [Caerostris darwini]